MSEQNTTETPSFSQLLMDVIEGRLCDLHTSLPAKIVSYDSSTGMADVQILIKRKFKTDDSAVDLPIVNKVPVLFPRTAKAFIHFPLAADDIGHLIFSERSLDRWKSFGDAQDPQDPRKHDLSDAVFLLGGYPETGPAEGILDKALHMKNDKAEISLLPDGDIEIKNSIVNVLFTKDGKMKFLGGAGELVDLQGQHLDADIAHTHPTAVGPSGPPVNIAVYQALKVIIDALKV